MTIFVPHQCSEREPGGWEDCVWCAGVMLNNAVHGKNVRPSTREEYESLRVAGGDGPREHPGDGSNHQQLVDGIRRRYDWVATRLGPPGLAWVPWSTVLNHLAHPGDAAALQGSMGVWGYNSHWRRWDRQFAGPHDVLVIRRDGYRRLWWMNPQAPNDFGGEWISFTEAGRYYNGMRGGVVLGKVGALKPKPVYRVHIDPRAKIRIYQLDGSCIESWTDSQWGMTPSSAFASGPVRRKTCDGLSGATTSYIPAGPLKGHLRIGAMYGVTLEEVS